MIILKVTKSQGFTLSLENTLFGKPQRGEGRGQTGPPPFIKSLCEALYCHRKISLKCITWTLVLLDLRSTPLFFGAIASIYTDKLLAKYSFVSFMYFR